MSYTDEAKKAAEALGKQGKAFIEINLVRYANNTDFDKDPPSCRVTVTARDPGDNNKVVQTETTDIPTTIPPYSHRFGIRVQTTVKSIGRYFGFPQKRSLSIDVVAEPIGGYEEWYSNDTTIKGLVIEAGSDVKRSVSFKPTYEGSRFNIVKKHKPPPIEPKA